MAYLFHAFTFNVVMSLYLKSFLKKVFHCISYFFILGIFVSIIFGQFTFKIIIDICLSYFFLFGCSVFCSHSLSLFKHYSGLLEHFLVCHFNIAAKVNVSVAQSCPTLSDPMDYRWTIAYQAPVSMGFSR